MAFNEPKWIEAMVNQLHEHLREVTTEPHDLKVRIGHTQVTATGAPRTQQLGVTNDAHPNDLQELHLNLRAEAGYAFCRHCWHMKPEGGGCDNRSCIENEPEFNEGEYALTPRPIKD